MYRTINSLFSGKSYLFSARSVVKPLSCIYCKARCYSDGKEDDSKRKTFLKNHSTLNENSTDESIQPGLESRYKVFQEEDAPILLDVYGEKTLQEDVGDTSHEEFDGLSLERGVAGVFEIEHLVELLRREKAQDIFVAEIPPETNYVDHIAIVSARSRRHMIALAEIVRKMFKKKRNPTDIVPRIEGEGSTTWIALDLGNIALHIFSHNSRGIYDLETLWSVGTEYDSLSNVAEDPLIALLKKHSISLHDVTSKGQLL